MDFTAITKQSFSTRIQPVLQVISSNMGGGIFRVAQICNKRYGEAVIIQKATYDGYWRFEEVRRLYSDVKYWNLGLHTFNVKDGCVVCDLKGYRHSRIACVLIKIISVVRMLKH